jgi:hypothetical protein
VVVQQFVRADLPVFELHPDEDADEDHREDREDGQVKVGVGDRPQLLQEAGHVGQQVGVAAEQEDQPEADREAHEHQRQRCRAWEVEREDDQVQREDAEEDQPEHRVETAGRLGGLGRGGTRK